MHCCYDMYHTFHRICTVLFRNVFIYIYIYPSVIHWSIITLSGFMKIISPKFFMFFHWHWIHIMTASVPGRCLWGVWKGLVPSYSKTQRSWNSVHNHFCGHHVTSTEGQRKLLPILSLKLLWHEKNKHCCQNISQNTQNCDKKSTSFVQVNATSKKIEFIPDFDGNKMSV